jgi:hypothetical protein
VILVACPDFGRGRRAGDSPNNCGLAKKNQKAVERLNEIREVKKALEEEERALREALQNVVRAAGVPKGALAIRFFVLLLPPNNC